MDILATRTPIRVAVEAAKNGEQVIYVCRNARSIRVVLDCILSELDAEEVDRVFRSNGVESIRLKNGGTVWVRLLGSLTGMSADVVVMDNEFTTDARIAAATSKNGRLYVGML